MVSDGQVSSASVHPSYLTYHSPGTKIKHSAVGLSPIESLLSCAELSEVFLGVRGYFVVGVPFDQAL